MPTTTAVSTGLSREACLGVAYGQTYEAYVLGLRSVLCGGLSFFRQVKAIASVGQTCPKWTHQAPHRQRHPKLRLRGHGNERLNDLHRVPGGPRPDSRDQTSDPCHDHQKRRCSFFILFFRKAGSAERKKWKGYRVPHTLTHLHRSRCT